MYICVCMCVFVNEVYCFINEFIINNYNWHGLLHCYFFIIMQVNWPFHRNHLGQIPLILPLLYKNCSLIFKHNCSSSKCSVLVSRLIYRCFPTLFSTSIFDCNFETFCSCKFIFCVLKSIYIDYRLIWMLDVAVFINQSMFINFAFL